MSQRPECTIFKFRSLGHLQVVHNKKRHLEQFVKPKQYEDLRFHTNFDISPFSGPTFKQIQSR